MIASLNEARERDAADPLAIFADRFVHPERAGQRLVYLCGNSLGLKPRAADDAVAQVLAGWGGLAVDAHFEGHPPWYRYDEPIAAACAPLVGAHPGEVAMANSLTVDLHLLMASFYRPLGRRRLILTEAHAFPSDRYAVSAQAAWHDLDPSDTVVAVSPNADGLLGSERVIGEIERLGDELSLVLLGSVNYLTGEVLDIAPIVAAAHSVGAVVGLDLAHGAGNVPCSLHEWGVDFAAWCTYKYLNSGPGSVAGFFVHERHGNDPGWPRLAGWWGNDPDRRFAMTEERQFVPRAGADGWKVSNPPILALAPVGASLALFGEAGFDNLRTKSVQLTADLAALVDDIPGVRCLTPDAADARGCQLSLQIPEARTVHRRLHEHGIIGDLRDPDVIRLAPTPLYNSWKDVWRAAEVLRVVVADR